MQIEFKGTNPTIDVYILTHGDWSVRLVENLKEHFGLVHDYYIFPLSEECSFSTYSRIILKHINENKSNHAKIIVVDLMNSSTSRCGLSLSYEHRFKIPVFSSLSLPVLLCVEECLIKEQNELFSLGNGQEKIGLVSLMDYYHLFEKEM